MVIHTIPKSKENNVSDFSNRYRTMSSDKDSDEENQIKKCNCVNGCSKTSCSCIENGSGCNSSCVCNSSCENIFNHLDYFFGEDSQCSAHPCFANWLIKKVQNVDDLRKINRDAIRKRIRKCSK